MDRRAAVAAVGAAAFGSALKGSVSPGPRLSVGRLKQSVSRWPYRQIPLPEFARAAVVAGLNQIKAQAEARRVTICLELLNSKVDHADYQGDRTAFGVAVVKAVGSPRVKLLYDIYHMQIMEGDIIRTIRDNKDWIAHFH